MTEQNALSIQHESQSVVMFDDSKIELIKRTIAKGATNDELDLFLNQCRRTQLDPFLRQIYMRKQWDSREGREVASTGITIDGFRIIAERSNKYAGQLGPYWCDADGVWVDVWLKSTPPAAAKVGVLRTDFKEPLWAVAKYSEYVQTKKDGQPNSMWVKMPASQLAKCAESLAHRKAFPHDLSGLYTVEEMGQAENVIEVNYEQAPQRQPAPAPKANGNGTKPAPAPVAVVEAAPMPDDEVVIAETRAADFFDAVTALVGRYENVFATQAAAKKLGFKVVPKDVNGRLEMYRAIKAHAAERDAEDSGADIFDEEE